MRPKSAEHRQEKGYDSLPVIYMGGRIPLPRTGGAPERTDRIVGQARASVKEAPSKMNG